MDAEKERLEAADGVAGTTNSTTSTDAEAAPSVAAKPTAVDQLAIPGTGSKAEQAIAPNHMSYIDRIVFEVENDRDKDGDGEDANEDSDSNWSSSDESEEAKSDDEMECDSDEEESLQVVVGTEDDQSHMFGGGLGEENKDLLLWRKEDSFSDWTIEVSVAERSSTLYHVHKFALGAGPQKSGYCEALFKSGQFHESADSTSVVKLPEDIAAFFPDFLDYVYSPPSECACVVNRENRRSLQHLASYFIVPKLTEMTRDFVKKDMHNLEHMEEYLSEFGGTDDEESRKLLSLAGRVCTDMVLSIELDSPLLFALTPAMILQMVSRARPSEDIKALSSDKQLHTCRLALKYINHHGASLDECFFHALLSELYFPDDIKHAGPLACELLCIMNRTGWNSEQNEEDLLEAFTAVYSRYLHVKLAEGNWTVDRIAKDTENMPTRVFHTLLTEALNSKQSREETAVKVSAKMEHTRHGSTFTMDIWSTYSINFIRYLVSRRWNTPMGELCIWCNGSRLENEQIVSNYNLSPNTTLKVNGDWRGR